MGKAIENQFEPDVEEIDDESEDAREDSSGADTTEAGQGQEEDDGEGEGGAPDDGALRKANNEAKKHRMRAVINQEVPIALAEAGVPPAKLRRAARVLGNSFKVTDGQVVGLDEAIAELKTDVPELFAAAEEQHLIKSPLTLPSTGSRRTRRSNNAQESEVTRDKRLREKYPSIRDAVPGRKR